MEGYAPEKILVDRPVVSLTNRQINEFHELCDSQVRSTIAMRGSNLLCFARKISCFGIIRASLAERAVNVNSAPVGAAADQIP
jgi:hypothetical protein